MGDDTALNVLDHYLGTWEIIIESEGAPFSGGEFTARWVMDGSFVEKTGYLSSGDHREPMETTTWITFDASTQAYRMWSFMTGGIASEASASWNPEARAMTEVREHEGLTITLVTTFTSQDVQQWVMETAGPDGTVVSRMTGMNRRIRSGAVDKDPPHPVQ